MRPISPPCRTGARPTNLPGSCTSRKKSHACAMSRSNASSRRRPTTFSASFAMPRLLDAFVFRIVLAAALVLGGGGQVIADSYEDSLIAARNGDTGALVRLLERGIDPNTIDSESNSLLILAAREGHA